MFKALFRSSSTRSIRARSSGLEDETVSIVGLDQITAQAWDGVLAGPAAPQQRYCWVLSAAEAKGSVEQARAIVVGPRSAPRAVAAFLVARRWSRDYGLLGNQSGSFEVPYQDEAALAGLARAMVSLRRPIKLGHYPDHTALEPLLRDAAGWRALVLKKPLPMRGGPYIDLDETWADAWSHLGSNRRRDLRRRERKARELGELTIEFLTPAPQEVDAALEAAFQVEAKSWKSRSGTSLLDDQAQADFYSRYGKRIAADQRLRIGFLKIDGKPIAMNIAEVSEGKMWSYKIGYDESYYNLSPGRILRVYMLQYASNIGLSQFYICGKETSTSKDWTDKARDGVALYVFPLNAHGLFALLVDGTQMVTKKLRQRWHAARHAGGRRKKQDPAAV